jgi:imidazolonepropionase-like amidohydrolase
MFTRRFLAVAVLLLVACATPRAIEPGAPVTAFTNATVITEYGGQRLTHQTVAVRAGRIIAIGRDNTITLPEGTTIIDAHGRILAPGVADMHVHNRDPTVGILFLANSITTIRNPSSFGIGDGPGTALDIQARTQRGEVVGPFVYASGQLIDGPNSFWGHAVETHTVDEVRTRVRQDAEAGYMAVKLYANLSPEQFQAGVEEARAHHLQVWCHVPASMTLEQVLATHVDSIEHLDGFDRSLGGEGRDRHARWAAAPADRIAPLAQEVARSGVWQNATLIVSLASSRAFVDINAADAAPEMRYATQELLDFWHSSRARFPAGTDFASRYHIVQQAHARRIEMLRALHEAHALLLIGTDAPNPYVMFGHALHDEFGFYREAGFTNTEILRIATLDAARFLNQAGEFGVIREGARADLLLLDGDPEQDLATLRTPAGVMASGRWFDRAALDTQLTALAQAAAASRTHP